mgnify:CR=1 FL=1
MYRVGLTGGIGSGKTTVARLFEKHGIPVIDTDQIAHQIMLPEGPAYQAIIEQFGDDILDSQLHIDRKKLAAIVFNSDEQKKKLEAILHPLIWLIVEQQVQGLNSPYCIIVVPLLIEGQHQKRFNSIIVVDVAEEDQLERVTKRDGRKRDETLSIINSQASRQQRLKYADHVICNDKSIEDLTAIVRSLHENYLEQSDSI